MVSEVARERILDMIERGGGGCGVAGGRPRPAGAEDGCYLGATILDGARAEMDIVREEIFGRCSRWCMDSLDEALDTIAHSRFGNGVSIFTESGAAVRRFKHDVDAGMVGVNIGVAAPVAFFPFSGWKDSLGDLHAHGPDAVEFYTKKKTVTSRFYSSGESGSYFVETRAAMLGATLLAAAALLGGGLEPVDDDRATLSLARAEGIRMPRWQRPRRATLLVDSVLLGAVPAVRARRPCWRIGVRGRPALMIDDAARQLRAQGRPVAPLVVGLGYNSLWERDRRRYSMWAARFDREASVRAPRCAASAPARSCG